ncbi:MAG: hypothetical protein ABWY58_07780 [Aeromicrobium sp.]
MRTPILTRAAIAVATVGLGSVALAAGPATAATSHGITRDMVLTAAAGVRADGDFPFSDATTAAVGALVSRSCDLTGAAGVQNFAETIDTRGSVDALIVVSRFIADENTHDCTFVAIASSDASLSLSGDLAVTDFGTDEGATPYQLSGDVMVSKAVTTAAGGFDTGFTAVGATVGSTKVLETFKVPDKKTKSDKALARTKYDTRVTNAKRAYGKALEKADTKAEKRAAKQAYSARKAVAKKKFKYAVASYKFAKVRTTRKVLHPFSVKVAPQLG